MGGSGGEERQPPSQQLNEGCANMQCMGSCRGWTRPMSAADVLI